ncbi:dgat1 [Symbiodinium natans]|uniref:Dgat1 protein n=1 Tax=Symbiodinium natans TaxID=878477 RepID=A0A812UZE0_9DINO|nr:dgat1 [Symbiodinium natans]
MQKKMDAMAAMGGEDPVAERYESPTAMTLGLTVFSSSFLGLFVAAALASHSMLEFLAASLLWPACLLWLNWCVLVPVVRRGRLLRRVKTALGCLGLFLAPVCTEATRRGPGRIIGASESAAAILCTARALQLLLRLEAIEDEEKDEKEKRTERTESEKEEKRPEKAEEKAEKKSSSPSPPSPQSPRTPAWGRWRRFYHMACLSWHDVDRVKALQTPREHRNHYQKTFQEFLLAALGLAACALALHILPSSFALARGQSGYVGLSIVRVLICCFGAGSVVFGFYTFDRAYLFLLSYFNRLCVHSIFGPQLWQAKTIKDFWRQWNLPVQRMLSEGIFVPLRKTGCSPSCCGFFVFLASGLGHAWPLLCVGAQTSQITMMLLFFITQIIPLQLESKLQIRSRAWVYTVEVLLSPLFVLPLLQMSDARLLHLSQS